MSAGRATALDLGELRPVERRMSRLAAAGVTSVEIGTRFKRSSEFVERVLEFAQLPGRGRPRVDTRLRPIERRLLHWRATGATPADLASRFGRSPDNIERVLGFADLKRSREVDAAR